MANHEGTAEGSQGTLPLPQRQSHRAWLWHLLHPRPLPRMLYFLADAVESPSACHMSQVKMTSQHELLFAKEKGIPIIDIRPPDDFNAAHIPGYRTLMLALLAGMS